MKTDGNCSITPADHSRVKTVKIMPDARLSDYQEAMMLAKREAEKRFVEYMLVSWYDRDRDFESPAGTSECDHGVPGYVLYGINHGARLKVDVEAGRFVFYFSPVEW